MRLFVRLNAALLISTSILASGPAFAENPIVFRYNPKVVTVAALEASPLNIPDLYVGEHVSVSASASGGVGQLSWSHDGALPPGLSLSSSGVLSGSPSSAGNYDAITMTATDETGTQMSFTQTISVYNQLTDSEFTTALGLNSAQTLSIPTNGGKGPYTYSVTSGTLPDGLTVSGSRISGTTTHDGVFASTLRVTDQNNRSATVDVALSVFSELVASASLQDAYVGEAYSGKFEASGGSNDYRWTPSNLPHGISLNESTGLITGSFSTAGQYSLSANVTDGYGFKTANGQVTAYDQLVAVNNIPSTVKMTETVNVTMNATGGKTPYKYTAVDLPLGLSLDENGRLTGTPLAVGTFNSAITVTDANGRQATSTKSVVSEAGVIMATMSGGNGAISLRSLFSDADWNSNTPKVVTLPAGQVRGSTTASPVVTVGGNWGGTLTFNVQGEIQGKGGSANSGAGGHAFQADGLSTAGSKLAMNITGAVRGGGGGGGAGGQGGTGGNGQGGGSAEGPLFNRAVFCTDDPATWAMFGCTYGASYWSENGGGFAWRGVNVGSSASGSLTVGNCTYTRGSYREFWDMIGYYYEVSKTCATPTWGGGGGAGGIGGVGMGYAQGNTPGTGGQGGAGPSGDGAGWGGTGGSGNWGNEWGLPGLDGIAGSQGGNGNISGGSWGTGGTAGGAAGGSIVWSANVNLTNSGTINGPLL